MTQSAINQNTVLFLSLQKGWLRLFIFHSAT